MCVITEITDIDSPQRGQNAFHGVVGREVVAGEELGARGGVGDEGVGPAHRDHGGAGAGTRGEERFDGAAEAADGDAVLEGEEDLDAGRGLFEQEGLVDGLGEAGVDADAADASRGEARRDGL